MQFPTPFTKPQAWFSALALSTLAIGLSATAGLTQEMKQQALRILTISGQGIEQVQTTTAQISLGVEVQGKTSEAVQAEAAQRSSALVALLKSRNVEKLQTTGINLSPRYSYENNRQRLDGYNATNTVSFRVPSDRAGRLMDEAVKAGASRIDGISFVASDEALKAARQKALIEATQNAREEANVILEALNLKATAIVNIQVDGAYAPPPPRPMMMMAKAAGGEAMADTAVVAGEQEVRASVTLQIQY